MENALQSACSDMNTKTGDSPNRALSTWQSQNAQGILMVIASTSGEDSP